MPPVASTICLPKISFGLLADSEDSRIRTLAATSFLMFTLVAVWLSNKLTLELVVSQLMGSILLRPNRVAGLM